MDLLVRIRYIKLWEIILSSVTPAIKICLINLILLSNLTRRKFTVAMNSIKK